MNLQDEIEKAWNTPDRPPSMAFVEGFLAGMKSGAAAEREACAMMLDAEADKQEREWNEYLASGKQGPATSLHGIPRGYAAEIRMRSNGRN